MRIARRPWTDEEIEALRLAYSSARTSEELDVRSLALRLSRSYNSVVVKAGRLGLTDIKRLGVNQRKDRRKYETVEELRAAQSRLAKERIEKNGHPKGFAGHTHTDEARKVIGEKASAWSASLTDNERSELIAKGLRTKVKRFGSVNSGRSRGSWKAGWREIGGKRNFYRSRWEANYARYLEWLKSRALIADWQHEPETFWFDKIKRGVRSYLPDFRVWELDGSTKLYEIKGWMDSRSKTTLRRMAKYHPAETIILVREKEYNAVARIVRDIIPDWENSERGGRL